MFVKTLNHFVNIAKIMTHRLGTIQQTDNINVVAGSLVSHA